MFCEQQHNNQYVLQTHELCFHCTVLLHETLLYVTLNVVIGDLDKDQSTETTCYFY